MRLPAKIAVLTAAVLLAGCNNPFCVHNARCNPAYSATSAPDSAVAIAPVSAVSVTPGGAISALNSAQFAANSFHVAADAK